MKLSENNHFYHPDHNSQGELMSHHKPVTLCDVESAGSASPFSSPRGNSSKDSSRSNEQLKNAQLKAMDSFQEYFQNYGGTHDSIKQSQGAFDKKYVTSRGSNIGNHNQLDGSRFVHMRVPNRENSGHFMHTSNSNRSLQSDFRVKTLSSSHQNLHTLENSEKVEQDGSKKLKKGKRKNHTPALNSIVDILKQYTKKAGKGPFSSPKDKSGNKSQLAQQNSDKNMSNDPSRSVGPQITVRQNTGHSKGAKTKEGEISAEQQGNPGNNVEVKKKLKRQIKIMRSEEAGYILSKKNSEPQIFNSTSQLTQIYSPDLTRKNYFGASLTKRGSVPNLFKISKR